MIDDTTSELAWLAVGTAILASTIYALVTFGPQIQQIWNAFIQGSRPNF